MVHFSIGRPGQGKEANKHAGGVSQCRQQVHSWPWKDAEAKWVDYHQEH